MKAGVFVPAGPRVMQGDPEERPEFIARQEWGQTSLARECQEAGIGFGFELKAPEHFPGDFTPEALNSIPYAIHANSGGLTRLYRAEHEGDNVYIEQFWARLEKWTRWEPSPLYVVFHGGYIGPAMPLLDENRFNCNVDPEEWLRFAHWHVEVLKKIRHMGLPVALETIYLNQFVWTDKWLPMTHFLARVGIYQDLVNITREAGILSVVDMDHLEGAVQALNSQYLEIQDVESSKFADLGASKEFESFFGFAAEEGKICRSMLPASWQSLVSELKTSHYHVGGIGRYGQIQQVEDERVIGSETPIETDDQPLRKMIRHVLKLQAEEPLTFVVEVSGSQDIPGRVGDGLESSFVNLQRILLEEIRSV